MAKGFSRKLTKRLPFPTEPVQKRESDEQEDTREDVTEEQDNDSSLPRA